MVRHQLTAFSESRHISLRVNPAAPDIEIMGFRYIHIPHSTAFDSAQCIYKDTMYITLHLHSNSAKPIRVDTGNIVRMSGMSALIHGISKIWHTYRHTYMLACCC